MGTDEHAVSDLAAFLYGTWRVEREIHDPSRDDHIGRFRGTARFEAVPPGPGSGRAALRHVEVGRAEFGTYGGPATRVLRYDVRGAHADVRFEDGRAFHDLDLRGGVWAVTHVCGEDVYEGRFVVETPDRWRTRWTVRGPDKDHVIGTVLQRM